MSFAVFLLLGFALYVFYRYVKNHERLVEQVQIMNQVSGSRKVESEEEIFVPGVRPSAPVVTEGLAMLRKFLV